MRSSRTDRQQPPPGAVRRGTQRSRRGVRVRVDDCVAEEIPVALLFNDQPHAVMMATPHDLEDFARGFALSEGIVAASGEIGAIARCDQLAGIELRVNIPPARAAALEVRRRGLTGRTGCGLCGIQMLEDAVRQPPPVGRGPRIREDALAHALAAIGAHQPVNLATGAVHAAAWCTRAGDVALLREDIGRHNALDKLLGAMAAAGTDVGDGFLLLTSRASYEMVMKAATCGIAVVAAMSAATALAIALAEQAEVTLIGFARPEGHTIYTRPERLAARGEAAA